MGLITKFVNARINANRENFSDGEIKFIQANQEFIIKLYSLGILDGLNLPAKEE